jgi:hypothetical protein
MVIKGTVRTFFTHTRDVQSNMVNSWDVRPLGPPRVLSCQSQAIPAEDGVTTRGNLASALTWLSGKADPIRPEGQG